MSYRDVSTRLFNDLISEVHLKGEIHSEVDKERLLQWEKSQYSIRMIHYLFNSLIFLFSVNVHLIKSWWEWRLMLTQAAHTLHQKQSLQNGIWQNCYWHRSEGPEAVSLLAFVVVFCLAFLLASLSGVASVSQTDSRRREKVIMRKKFVFMSPTVCLPSLHSVMNDLIYL